VVVVGPTKSPWSSLRNSREVCGFLASGPGGVGVVVAEPEDGVAFAMSWVSRARASMQASSGLVDGSRSDQMLTRQIARCKSARSMA
jgi:hypothetical protein